MRCSRQGQSALSGVTAGLRLFNGSAVGLLLCLLSGHSAAADALALVQAGHSNYCISYPPAAPLSVQGAARELQDYVRRASDANLSVVTRPSPGCGHYIYLGNGPAAASAGIVAAELPFEAFHITSRNNDLYIIGRDTRDGELTPFGGTSHGTRNGVYSFLEDVVGVRWLMPGEVGEDVPWRRDIYLKPLDRVEAPAFENRRIPYIQNDNPLVLQWLQRQKQGYSLQLNHYHNFRRLIPAGQYDEHPDWFPQRNGKRPRPSGRYKLETTNAELVRAVGRQVSRSLARDPSLYSFSISPSDSGGWSTSPESLALYDRDPHGRESVTPLVLDFYRHVAQQVAKKFNDRILCGYIYTNYLFPPSTGIPHLPDNLCLVLAPNMSYGYGLYRETTRKDLELLLRQWGGATPQVAYYDLPVNLLQSVGAPNPPGLEILTYLYPKIAAAGMRGVYMYGVSAWGQGALTNYLLAKLNWDPHADVDALTQEFFQRAYGGAAGPLMQQLYARLDAANKQYHRQDEAAGYRLTPALLQAVYVPLVADIRRLFSEAQHQVATPLQRQRLWMFQANMQRFVDYLQAAGLTSVVDGSPFSAEALRAARPNDQTPGLELALAPAPDAGEESAYKLRLRLMVDKVLHFFRQWTALHGDESALNPQGPSATLRGRALMALYPQQNGEVDITFTKVVDFGESVRFRLHDANGQVLRAGSVRPNTVVQEKLAKNRVYFLDIYADKAIVQSHVHGAYLALATQLNARGLHLFGTPGSLEFIIPVNVTDFSIALQTESSSETAAADIYAPGGRHAASLDTSDGMSSELRLRSKQTASGVWRVVGRKPRAGVVDDVWLQLDKRLPPWLVVSDV